MAAFTSMNDSTSRHRIRRAWERFIAGDASALGEVRPPVRESWARSRESGVDPRRKAAPTLLGAEETNRFREENQQLRDAAAPVLRLVRRAVEGNRFILLVSDARCRVLEVVGDPRTKSHAEEINVVPGSQWSEEEMGTDAIALSTLLGVAVQVRWSEHYLEISHPWVGNTAPIYRPLARELVGSFTIYGYEAAAHPQTLKLATDAVKMLERELQRAELQERLVLYQRYDDERRKAPNGSWFALDPKGFVTIGDAAASRLVGRSPEALALDPFFRTPGLEIEDAALQESEPCRARMHVQGRGSFTVSIEPVRMGKRRIGFVVHASPLRTLRKPSPHAAWPAFFTFDDILGGSQAIRETVAEAARLAASDLPVLIAGESGTGKELFAQAIHNASARSAGPFVPLNCGGLSDDLLSAELFGYSEGAFTGALATGKSGKLEIASGGTLFLDEVEDTSPTMQVHLLRALEDGCIVRIGDERPRPIDVRVISATNARLDERIAAGKFRHDLFYRLAVTVLDVPPLRDRRGDVRLLANEFLREAYPEKEMSEAAALRLAAHFWPGNVRELRNVILQAGTRQAGTILPENLPGALRDARFASPSAGGRGRDGDRAAGPHRKAGSLEAAERAAILDALRDCRGNVSLAAVRLELHRVTLHRKLRKHGIHAKSVVP